MTYNRSYPIYFLYNVQHVCMIKRLRVNPDRTAFQGFLIRLTVIPTRNF